MTLDALVTGVSERMAAARDAVKGDVDIILELHRKLTPLQAMPVATAATWRLVTSASRAPSLSAARRPP